MEAKHALRLAGLADAAADFIQQHPLAAEFVARRLGQILDSSARRELADEERREEEARRSGRPVY